MKEPFDDLLFMLLSGREHALTFNTIEARLAMGSIEAHIAAIRLITALRKIVDAKNAADNRDIAEDLDVVMLMLNDAEAAFMRLQFPTISPMGLVDLPS